VSSALTHLGSRRFFMLVWVFLQAIGFAFGIVQYGLNDDYNNARTTFGYTFGEHRGLREYIRAEPMFLRSKTASSLTYRSHRSCGRSDPPQ
jgi:hypothetical protein